MLRGNALAGIGYIYIYIAGILPEIDGTGHPAFHGVERIFKQVLDAPVEKRRGYECSVIHFPPHNKLYFDRSPLLAVHHYGIYLVYDALRLQLRGTAYFSNTLGYQLKPDDILVQLVGDGMACRIVF